MSSGALQGKGDVCRSHAQLFDFVSLGRCYSLFEVDPHGSGHLGLQLFLQNAAVPELRCESSLASPAMHHNGVMENPKRPSRNRRKDVLV